MIDFGEVLRDICTPPPRCGSCKGTGEKHEWSAAGELVRVKPLQLCEECCGGIVLGKRDR